MGSLKSTVQFFPEQRLSNNDEFIAADLVIPLQSCFTKQNLILRLLLLLLFK